MKTISSAAFKTAKGTGVASAALFMADGLTPEGSFLIVLSFVALVVCYLSLYVYACSTSAAAQ